MRGAAMIAEYNRQVGLPTRPRQGTAPHRTHRTRSRHYKINQQRSHLARQSQAAVRWWPWLMMRAA
jgi:hypothetical protein